MDLIDNKIERIESGIKIEIPRWLDDYIFRFLSAKYSREKKDMVVLDWNHQDILTYLGTNFPRSYSESFYIFSNYMKKNEKIFEGKECISVFDFGCGTGGELVGFLSAIKENNHYVKKIHIKALDGNIHALRILEVILDEVTRQYDIDISCQIFPIVIDDFYDLDIVTSVLNKKYDVFLTFKAICEFVTKQQFETKNPYSHIIKSFMPKMNNNGIMCLADVTSYNNISKDWLPKMLDAGISGQGLKLVDKNNGYNESFHISHSMKKDDISKIAWRILKI